MQSKFIKTYHSPFLPFIVYSERKTERSLFEGQYMVTGARGNYRRGREEIIQAQNEMDKLFEETIEGSKIRAKVNYLEINEKPTRLFRQREK